MAKYCKEKTEECASWVRENGLIEHGGATLMSFCEAMGIDNKTYYSWMKKPEFSDSIKKAKEDFRSRLEVDIVDSLARSAKGHEYTQETVEWGDVKGKLVVKKRIRKTVRVEPNIGAAIFLLTNIAPERWRNRRDIDFTDDEVKEAIKGNKTIVEFHDYTKRTDVQVQRDIQGSVHDGQEVH